MRWIRRCSAPPTLGCVPLRSLPECRVRDRGRGHGDDGVTLIEVLVAAAILGTVVLGLVTGIMTAVKASDLHRREARTEVAMRQYIESLEAQPYVACAVANFAPQTIDTYELSVVAKDSWIANSNPVAFQSGCAVSDTGAYRLTINLVDPTGKAPQTVNVVLRSSS